MLHLQAPVCLKDQLPVMAHRKGRQGRTWSSPGPLCSIGADWLKGGCWAKRSAPRRGPWVCLATQCLTRLLSSSDIVEFVTLVNESGLCSDTSLRQGNPPRPPSSTLETQTRTAAHSRGSFRFVWSSCAALVTMTRPKCRRATPPMHEGECTIQVGSPTVRLIV